jgi:hypothetical protein
MKPCPFCFGEKVEVEELQDPTEWVCICQGCWGCGPVMPTRDLAVKYWSLRRYENPVLWEREWERDGFGRSLPGLSANGR